MLSAFAATDSPADRGQRRAPSDRTRSGACQIVAGTSVVPAGTGHGSDGDRRGAGPDVGAWSAGGGVDGGDRALVAVGDVGGLPVGRDRDGDGAAPGPDVGACG